MALYFLLCSLLLVSAAKSDSSTTTDLLFPLPRFTNFGSKVYLLNAQTFVFLGSGKGGSSDILKDAFERYSKLIFETPAPFFPSGGGGISTQELDSMQVVVDSADESLGMSVNENCKSSYTNE